MRITILAAIHAFGLALGSTVGCAEATKGTCEELVDPTGRGPSVAITVENVGDAPVFLGEIYGCTSRYWELSRDGETVAGSPGSCGSCQAVMDGEGCGGCVQADCSGTELTRLEPGATLQLTWDGLIYDLVDLPNECGYDEDACAYTADDGIECAAGSPAATGAYVLRIDEQVAPTCDGGPCECPAGESTCVLWTDFEDSGTEVPIETTVDYPTSSLTIEVGG